MLWKDEWIIKPAAEKIFTTSWAGFRFRYQNRWVCKINSVLFGLAKYRIIYKYFSINLYLCQKRLQLLSEKYVYYPAIYKGNSRNEMDII